MGDEADVIGRLLVRVYEIHERIIARGGGGLEGMRDATLLHAAVARPFVTFGEVELYPTDFDRAAGSVACADQESSLHGRNQRPFQSDPRFFFSIPLPEASGVCQNWA